jgi:hypothetical protein
MSRYLRLQKSLRSPERQVRQLKNRTGRNLRRDLAVAIEVGLLGPPAPPVSSVPALSPQQRFRRLRKAARRPGPREAS